jgi:SAM-dependent methyltransferase
VLGAHRGCGRCRPCSRRAEGYSASIRSRTVSTVDPRIQFYEQCLNDLLPDRSASVLVVAGGDTDHLLLSRLGFSDVVISNLDSRVTGREFAPYGWSFQDAGELTYEDGSFDFVVVHAGLHHCSVPHKALAEMYRVARRGILAIEARDSALMRLLTRFRLAPVYEPAAVYYNDGRFGGVDNTQIPNFIYRWTEREVTKAINAYAPHVRHTIVYRYGSSFPSTPGLERRAGARLALLRLAAPVYKAFARCFPRQQNHFAFFIPKPSVPEGLQPWLTASDGTIAFDREWGDRTFRPRDKARHQDL